MFLYEFAHNIDEDVWVKIMPASGSVMELSSYEEAKSMMVEGTWLGTKIENGFMTHYKKNENGEIEVEWTGSLKPIKNL